MDIRVPSQEIELMNYITGTTRGLGRALLGTFQSKHAYEEFKPLDRPWHDLSKDLDKFVKNDFGIYILNAHYEWAQTELLYKLFEANKNRECQIVVIGSVSADGDRKEVNRYAIQKKALDAACTQLQLVPSECFITQIKLGRIDTDLVKHIDAPKMNVRDVSRMIYDVIAMNHKNHYVKSITIDNKDDQ